MIHELLHQARDRTSLSMPDLAERLFGDRTRRADIANIEAGRRSISIRLAERWLAACGARLILRRA